MALLRLDKLLANQGLASRKELKEIIRSGRVQIDGKAVTRPETMQATSANTIHRWGLGTEDGRISTTAALSSVTAALSTSRARRPPLFRSAYPLR